jgi:predicted metalloprotease with PDZ domain
LSRDLCKICRAHIDLFGAEHNSRAPFDRYVFLVLAIGGETYGGLEHRASTSLMLPRDGLPQPGAATVSDAYRASLGVASHEYFHAWNVKRIKPAAFVPYDLSRENYTEQLWIFEGFTSYYDDLMLRRAGVIDTESYLELLGRAITRHLRTPARATQSVAASSFDAWIKYYRQDENAPNAVVSYYVKGSLVALALDLTLRRIGTTSLDDVMRAAWTQYGLTGAGVPERGIEAIASALAGRELTSFFADYAHGTAELPLHDLLSAFGVSFSLRAPDGPNDKGGNAAKDAKPRASLGAVLAAGGDMALKHVFIDGPASVAGLAAGDKLVAIDGIRATPDAMERALQARRVGDRVEIHAFRRDELMTFQVMLESAPNDTCWLTLASDAPANVVARRDAWLSGTETTR